MIILESTGHYHLPVTRFLEDHHYLFEVVNPMLGYQPRILIECHAWFRQVIIYASYTLPLFSSRM